MPIAVLVLVVVAYAYAMIVMPPARRPGLVLGVAVAVGLAAYFWWADAETDEAATRITRDELVLDQLAIERTIRGAELSGRVLNRSDRFGVREMTLSLRMHDCAAENAALSDCPVVAEASAIARPGVPPGQIREFSARFLFNALPPPSDSQRWDWVITGIRATR